MNKEDKAIAELGDTLEAALYEARRAAERLKSEELERLADELQSFMDDNQLWADD